MAVINTFNIGNVTLPGAGFPPLGAFSLPFSDRLDGAFFLGYGEEIAQRNWGGDSEVSIVGNPEFSAGYASLSGGGFIETGVSETLAATLFLIFRETTGAAVGAFGNYGGTSSIGTSLYVQSASTTLSLNTGRVGGTGGAVTVGSTTSGWGIYSARIPATGQATLKNHISGSSSTSGASTDREISGAGPLRIGALYSAAFAGPSDVFAAMHYSADLTAPEADAVAAHLRQMAESAGLSFA